MKKFSIRTKLSIAVIAMAMAAVPAAANAEAMCQVHVCNKLSRVSLNPWSHIKDRLGKTCFDTMMPQSQAKAGATLSSESRWYQGSFNPTKKSITYIESVGRCQ